MSDAAVARIKRWRVDGPAQFAKEVMGAVPDEWQMEASQAVVKHRRVTIRSGHGVGKSAFLAWSILWFLCTRAPCRVPVTAPTAHQLSDVLWSEIAVWHRRMAEVMPALAEQIEVKSDQVCLKASPKESFAVARTARPEQPEAFQGFHGRNLMLVIDEASGVPDIIFEVGEGALSTDGAYVIMTGNPTRSSGYFYDSHHRMRHRWHCMQVSCERARMVGKRFIDDMAAKYGRESSVYRVRVLGEFPLADDDALIPLDLCTSAQVRDVTPHGPIVWGLDVARFGSDRTALAKRCANALLEPVKSWRGKDTMQVAGLVYAEWYATPPDMRPVSICVDVIGIGSGVVDRLGELRLPVVAVNVGESAAIGDQFMRQRDEVWWAAREWLMGKACRMPVDDELVAELTAPRYTYTSSGKIKVEGKDELRKRGGASPDLADAFCLTFAVAPVSRYDAVQLEPVAYDY